MDINYTMPCLVKKLYPLNRKLCTALGFKEKKHFNHVTGFCTSVGIVLMTFIGSNILASGNADKEMYILSCHQSTVEATKNKGIAHSVAKDIYWYIHSGIHDGNINIPPEGDLLPLTS